MEVRENLEIFLKTAEVNLKTGIDQIRYDLARAGLTKTPAGAETYLEQAANLLQNEILKVLNEIKTEIYKPKEWDPVRSSVNQYIENQYNIMLDFLVNNWEQPVSQVSGQLNLLKSSLLKEIGLYIDCQKIKLSKGEQVTRDIVKIFLYGLAAGIVAFLLKLIISR